MASDASFLRRQLRAELIGECNRRFGVPRAELDGLELAALQRLLSLASHESVIEAEEAHSMVDPLEVPRVHDFLSRSPDERTLLDGRVPASTFVACFLVWSGETNVELLANGRSLQNVVDTISQFGGMDAAADRVPWLKAAVPLARDLSFELLEVRRMFVRHATRIESISVDDSCPSNSNRYLIEEGQHRAIAAAWTLTQGGSRPPSNREVPYLRGVNRGGVAHGVGFWRLQFKVAPEEEQARHPAVELWCSVICLLCIWQSVRWGCREVQFGRRLERRRPSARLGGRASAAGGVKRLS